ncbi:MAG TPA: hypothetical protein VMW52_05980 [Phycisphaerae bacterium]|nr:hypothetical protein [Phycisphaerae bacterium]
MTRRDVLCVALIVTGVVALLYSTASLLTTLGSIVILLETVAGRGSPSYFLGIRYYVLGLVSPVLSLVAGVILLRYNEGLARALTSEGRPAVLSLLDGWERSLFSLALRVIGVIWLLRYIPYVVRTLALFTTQFVQGGQWPGGWDALTEMIENAFKNAGGYGPQSLLASLIVLVIGIYFVTGAKHLVTFIFRKRKPRPASVRYRRHRRRL